MLEKILEEIERLEKIQFSSYTEPLITLKDVKQMILKHMNGDECGECSRRKWYQKGYEDGKDINVFSKDNDGWIPCEERLPEESLNSVIGWDDYRERCCFVQYLGGRFVLGNDDEPVKITHWRPTPEPPYRPEKGAEE